MYVPRVSKKGVLPFVLQLEKRNGYNGAEDAASLMGYSPFLGAGRNQICMGTTISLVALYSCTHPNSVPVNRRWFTTYVSRNMQKRSSSSNVAYANASATQTPMLERKIQRGVTRYVEN
jgi:hypothetical protein